MAGSSAATDWVREEVSKHLSRQLQDADAEDAKTGLFLAFIGAVLVGALTVAHASEPARTFALASIALSVEALAFALWALYPRRFKDPPDPASFAADLLAGTVTDTWAVHQLIQTQLAAIDHNDRVLRSKLGCQVISGVFVTGATVMLLLEAATS